MSLVNDSNNGALPQIAKRITSVASDIATVRLGTVASNMVQLNETMVILDNDPSRTPINAMGVGSPLPAGSRVACLAYPPRGLLVLGVLEVNLADYDPVAPAIQQYTGDTSVAYPGDQYTFVEIEGCGGGGAGGGSAASTAGNASLGAGGGAGMYCRSIFRVDALVWPLAIDVGGGGAAVTGGAGGNGNRSQVNDGNGTKIWCAEGGVGGGTLANGNGTQSAAGGRGAADNLTQFLGQTAYYGGDGQSVIRATGAGGGTPAGSTAATMGGHGGSGFFGGGGRGGANGAGQGALVPGAGGGGSTSFNTGGAQAGGNGGVGMILVAFK